MRHYPPQPRLLHRARIGAVAAVERDSTATAGSPTWSTSSDQVDGVEELEALGWCQQLEPAPRSASLTAVRGARPMGDPCGAPTACLADHGSGVAAQLLSRDAVH